MEVQVGQDEVVVCPVGCFCVRCGNAITESLPHKTLDDIASELEHLLGAQAHFLSIVSKHEDGVMQRNEAPHGVHNVRRTSRRSDKLIALYDGFTKDEFEACHNGLSPGEAGVTGVQEVHPLTQEKVDIYYVPHCPSFQLQVSDVKAAEHDEEIMQKIIYKGQPDDIMEDLGKNIGSVVRSAGHVPTRGPKLSSMLSQSSGSGRQQVSTGQRGTTIVRPPQLARPSLAQALGSQQALATWQPGIQTQGSLPGTAPRQSGVGAGHVQGQVSFNGTRRFPQGLQPCGAASLRGDRASANAASSRQAGRCRVVDLPHHTTTE